GREKVSLIGVGEGQWLAVAPSGLFDGKADAMRQVSWRFGDIDPLNVVSFDTFFTDYFYPGLLSDIAKGDDPAPRLDLAAQLRLPSLRTMLLQGMARIEKRDGKTVLCLTQKPTARTLLVEDGLPTPLAPEDFTYEEDDPSCPHRKELAGDKQYEAINAAAVATRPTTEPVYNGHPSDTSLSTLHVLTVAVDKYDFAASGFKPLLSSVSGAKEIEKFFAGQKEGGGPYRHVRVWDGLFDGAATRAAIRGRLAEMGTAVREEDVVFLFFSGHGIVPVGQEMFYFAPADMRGPDPLLNRETGLNAAMLAEALREMPARRIVLVIDSCQSGGVIESLSKVGELKAKSAARQQRADIKAAGDTDGIGVYIIASATPLQEALQPVKGYGALVKALLDALRGGARDGDGNISIRAVTQYVRQKFATEAADADTAHTPMVYASGVNYPIVKYRE
ncbi:MAG TPA: caspase family protein, partial [Pyrinomonadaceae bacterium]|nr:caspase family protein [Pyrinomonadaceae bacterium]